MRFTVLSLLADRAVDPEYRLCIKMESMASTDFSVGNYESVEATKFSAIRLLKVTDIFGGSRHSEVKRDKMEGGGL